MIKKFKEWQKKRKLKNELEKRWRILMEFNIMGDFEAEEELYKGKDYTAFEKELVAWALDQGLTHKEIQKVRDRITIISI